MGVNITSRTGVFRGPTGQSLRGIIGPYSNNVRVPGNGTANWLDNIYLSPEVADVARTGGWSSVNLEETFYGRDDNGNPISGRAILSVSVVEVPPPPPPSPGPISPTLSIDGSNWVSIPQGGSGVDLVGSGFTPYGVVLLVIEGPLGREEGEDIADGGGSFRVGSLSPDCDTPVGVYTFQALDEATGIWSNAVVVEVVSSPSCLGQPPPPGPIPNDPPIASFSSDVYGLSVQFYDHSYNPDGYIAGVLWDFGDGEQSFEENPLHYYEYEGVYFVCLAVIDDRGETAGICEEVYVGEGRDLIGRARESAPTKASKQFKIANPEVKEVQVDVFDLKGKLIFRNGWVPNGFEWDLLGDRGRRMANRVYL